MVNQAVHDELLKKFQAHFGREPEVIAYAPGRIEVLGNYLDKADFGDCDILIESSDAYDPHQAAGVLDAVEVVRNGPVTSIGVIVRPEVPFRDGNVFQVDLIRMPPEAFDFALAYFGRDDVDNVTSGLGSIK